VRERLFRGDGFNHERSRREDFDPIAEGNRYGLTPEESTELWARARREATNHDGVCNESLARERFAQMAEQFKPTPGKRTQVEVASGAASARNVSSRVPGKTTQVLARASSHARVGVPGRTTLVASQDYSDVCTPEDSRGFFRRYIGGGHAARSKLERAVASRDHYAAVVAMLALQQDLRLARHHLANGLEHDEGPRGELAALEGSTAPLLAKLPNMSARDRSWELWGPESAEWRAAIGSPTESPESAAEPVLEMVSPRAERTQPESASAADRDELPGASDVARALAALQAPKPTETSGQARVDGAHGAEPRAPVRLPAPMRARMERAYGQPFGDVELHPDSAEVPVGQGAITRERRIYLEPGAVDLETQRGEHIIAHELAHAVQQRDSGERDGTRQELEHEAARAAALAMQGQTARIASLIPSMELNEAAHGARAATFGEDDARAGEKRAPSTAARGGRPGGADAPSQVAALREQFFALAIEGRGVGEALAATDPATTAAELPELRNRGVSLLRPMTSAAGGEVERALARGSTGAALPGELAARRSPHIGAGAADAARLEAKRDADRHMAPVPPPPDASGLTPSSTSQLQQALDPWLPRGLGPAAPNSAPIWHANAPQPMTLYRRAVSSGETDHSEVVAAALRQRGTGQTLPMELRREFEQVVGVSLAEVRVHTDALAARVARAVGAEAFTVGAEVFFAEGAFAPETRAGRKLIAHELTHVAQMLRGRNAPTHDGLQVSQPGDPAEHEADAVADRVDQLAPERVSIDATAGKSLPADVRARFESSFGADLGHVRIHRDARAEAWVDSLGANAATTANHIAFAAGQFAPSTPDGDRLIGHELAHVLQHANGRVAPGMTTPGDAAETEADHAGGRAAAGLPAGPIRAPAAAVARDVPGKRTELIEFEVDPTNPNQLVHEPTPEANALWIDSSMTQVGYTIWLFGFAVWVKDQPLSILIPSDHIRFTVEKAIPINHHIYNSYAEAVAAVAKTLVPASDKTPRYAYYWGAGGMVVAPTLICPATAPRTTETMLQARVKYAEYVQRELIGLAEMMILTKLLSVAYQRAGRVGGGEEPAPSKLGKTPGKAEPVKTHPVEAKPGKATPGEGEPVKGEPVKTRPVKSEPAKGEPAKGEPAKGEPAKTKEVSGETETTRIGKQVHKANADARRQSGDWDDVNTPMKMKDGQKVRVPKRVNPKTGEPVGADTQVAQPDAVSYKRGEILDDKPAGRPISKDRQEMIRNIEAYRQRTGELPTKIIIERYDPATGKHVSTETYSPSEFVP